MVLTKSNLCFLHIPKTGGMWVEQALKHAGIEYRPAPCIPYVHHRHAARYHLKGHYRKYFCFVRHPADWYASWWKYCQDPTAFVPDLRQWHPQNPLADLMDPDFGTFVNRVCNRFSDGYVSWLYRAYTGHRSTKGYGLVHFVGRTETAATGLYRILRQVGYRIPQSRFDDCPPYHVSKQAKTKPVWTPQLWQRVSQSESSALETFGYGEPPYVEA